ncbi:MAG: response regulator transcription factor [Bacteriovoracaceae bacterium]|nr:response regulator transcription factor [Bacteriovoracaceae bacterium]
MSKAGLLIVEDEENLGATLKDYFQSKGYYVEWAPNVARAHELLVKMGSQLDLALLDINLPDGNGLDLARAWRKQRQDLVVVFLSAMNDPALRVEGLEIGAEDYVTKPFELKELTLRFERILQYRKRSVLDPEEMKFGLLTFWPRRFEIKDATGSTSSLSQKEAAILQQLLARKGQVVSREELIEDIWGAESFPTNRTVDNYIVKLRKWCESDPAAPLKIVSVRGVGYRLD